MHVKLFSTFQEKKKQTYPVFSFLFWRIPNWLSTPTVLNFTAFFSGFIVPACFGVSPHLAHYIVKDIYTDETCLATDIINQQVTNRQPLWLLLWLAPQLAFISRGSGARHERGHHFSWNAGSAGGQQHSSTHTIQTGQRKDALIPVGDSWNEEYNDVTGD